MKSKFHHIVIFVAFLAMWPLYSFAQDEYQFIREGFKAYHKGEFNKAEVAFQKAKNIDSSAFIPNYNLASTYYKLERYDKAEQMYSALLDRAENPNHKAMIYYNAGNTQVKKAAETLRQQNLEESIKLLKQALDFYKHSLLINPEDKDAKYNYALTKEILKKLEQQNNKEQQNQQNQNKENEQNKDNEDKEQQNKDDEKKEQENKDKQQNKNEQKEGGKDDQKVKPSEISDKNAEMLLNIVKEKDKEILEKLKKIKVNQKAQKEKDW